MALDQRDEELLDAYERGFPITSTPFAILGQQTDLSEKDVIKRTRALRDRGLLKPLHASLEARAVGCDIALVVARIDPEEIETAAAAIGEHPGVTQIYQRNHAFNLWFSICIPPVSDLGVESTIAQLRALSGALEMLPLRALSQYVQGEETLRNAPPEWTPTHEEITFIRALEEELPLQPRPFDALARRNGLDRDGLLEFAREMNAEGRMRDRSFVVRRPGRFSTAAMGVWECENGVEETASILSRHPAVASATVRSTHESWPWNIFTIIQGSSVDECEAAMTELSNRSGVDRHLTLFPVRGFRTTGGSLYPPELGRWERDHMSSPPEAASAN